MKWDDLRAMAAKILDNRPVGPFGDKTFETGSGTLRVMEGLSIVHQSSEYAYPTVSSGPAYRTTVTVRCRDTGTQDAHRRAIYEHENGTLFVWSYDRGDEYRFDSGRIVSPVMAAENKQGQYDGLSS